jgi:hypothetical protein
MLPARDAAVGVYLLPTAYNRKYFRATRHATILGSTLDALVNEVLCPRPELDGGELRAAFVNMLPLFATASEVGAGFDMSRWFARVGLS